MSRYDAEVIVVGGGPAGSATAMLLALRGHDVLLLDKSSFPRHKACSEYLNAGAVQALNELDLLDQVIAAGAHVMDAMQVQAPDGSMFLADFTRAEPGKFALGLSRFVLDAIILDRARQHGVRVRERSHVREVFISDRDSVEIEATVEGSRHTLRAELVIGADGRHSAVSRSLGLDRSVRWPQRTGLAAHYRGLTGLSRFGELHVSDRGYAGLAPIEQGLTNVAFVSDRKRVAARTGSIESYFTASIEDIPAVADKLRGAERAGGIRGTGPMARRVRQASGNRFMLVGDAAGFLDPFTGDGIYEALRAAQIAAAVATTALRSGNLSARSLRAYRRERRRIFTTKGQVCWIVQGFIHHPSLMNYVTHRLSDREVLGLTLSGVLGNFVPARTVLSPIYLARLLRP
ncbi:hypothetical protein BH24CHL4_BH24CHL4_11550 [soil metagenome]